MSVRQKRLALVIGALGLIAAAPYAFNFVVERDPRVVSPEYHFIFGGGVDRAANARVLDAKVPGWSVQYLSKPQRSFLHVTGLAGEWKFILPPASITLRVACAVALAGVWGLVVGGRWLARRWTGKTAAEPAP